METSKDGMYAIEDGKVIPIKVDEMAWLLRYGDEKEIIKYRLYIAHIVNIYASQSKQQYERFIK